MASPTCCCKGILVLLTRWRRPILPITTRKAAQNWQERPHDICPSAWDSCGSLSTASTISGDFADDDSLVGANSSTLSENNQSQEIIGRTVNEFSPDSLWAHVEAKSLDVPPWVPKAFEIVKRVQDAPRNMGTVLLMRSLRSGGSFVAVKMMRNDWVTSSHKEFTSIHPGSPERPWVDVAMVDHLHSTGYEYVCEPRGLFRDQRFTYIVSKYAEYGDLFDFMMKTQTVGRARLEHLRPIIRQLLTAVRNLHDIGITHRDLSLENIVVTRGEDSRPAIKIIDFGMATLARSISGSCGKRSYVAPELFHPGMHDGFLVDIFALGVVLFALAFRSYPWDLARRGFCKRFDAVANRGLRTFVTSCTGYWDTDVREAYPEHYMELLEGLLAIDPSQRCGLGENCWTEEGVERESVWNFGWIRN